MCCLRGFQFSVAECYQIVFHMLINPAIQGLSRGREKEREDRGDALDILIIQILKKKKKKVKAHWKFTFIFTKCLWFLTIARWDFFPTWIKVFRWLLQQISLSRYAVNSVLLGLVFVSGKLSAFALKIMMVMHFLCPHTQQKSLLKKSIPGLKIHLGSHTHLKSDLKCF